MEEFYIDEDESWLNEIEKENALYNDFYLEKTDNINLNIIYINKNNNIEYIKKDKYFLNENTITKENLLYLLKKNSIYRNSKYNLLSIIKYNIDLQPENVKDYILNTKKYNFFHLCKTINNIEWNDSITLFKDINSLYLLYYEKSKNNNSTKKIYINKMKKKKRKNITRKIS
tara:strand:- start:3787 stop:4302 length:516 start_codon:yes stop_codon:yes gene_type:complete